MDELITKNYALYNGDCIDIMGQMSDNSIHLSIYSPPFAGLYEYSSSPRDLSNSRDYNEFMEHFDYVIGEMYRITKPGRMTAVHCMDIPLGNTGTADSIMDFPGDIIEQHVKCRDESCTAPEWKRRKGLCGHGWFTFNSRRNIWKEPLAVRNRTMAKKLAHQTIVEDAADSGVAGADYLLIFRKVGENEIPIENPKGLFYYAGAATMPAELMKYKGYEGKQRDNQYSHWIWRRYASSLWDDIRVDNVLPYKASRDKEDEKHVHPLQLDVIERTVLLFSNPDETVFTPFMGVGSEVYGAVKNDRMGVGVELKDTYYRQAVKNLEELERKV
ncbi:MAG: DNA methyltransferase, partial [Euryarchaeota archaeon]|nr:DNA methyltransferase [Euryarchaeota archaeon]